MEKFTKPELLNFLCDDLDGKYDPLSTSSDTNSATDTIG